MEPLRHIHHISECRRVHCQPVSYIKRGRRFSPSLCEHGAVAMRPLGCGDRGAHAHRKAALYQRSSHWRQHVLCQDCQATVAPMLLVALTKARVNGASGG